MSNAQLYDRDFYAWPNEQVQLLRTNRLVDADLENIAEGLETLARRERRDLISRVGALQLLLLKWQKLLGFRSVSVWVPIKIQRILLARHLRESPSLNGITSDAVAEAYRIAQLEAQAETGLAEEDFSSTCPYTFKQIMDENFWPDV